MVRTEIKMNSVFPQCHSGYIFCMITAHLPEDPSTEVLLSSSGDGTVKVRFCFLVLLFWTAFNSFFLPLDLES